jgi:hypothetical protein
MGGVVKAVGNFVGNVVNTVVNTVENIVKNPLPTIETIALSVVGVPPPVASAIVVGMNGGSPQDMLRASVASSIPIVGNEVSASLGVSPAAGNAIASAGVQVALGVPIDQALTNAATSAAVNATKPEVAAEVNSVISNPNIANAVTNAATSAESAILKGGSADSVTNAITSSLTNSTISAGLNLGKDLLSQQQGLPNVTPLSAAIDQTPIDQSVSSLPNAVVSPLDSTAPSPTTQPLNLPEETTSPIDTSFKPDYSLAPSSGLGNLGLKAPVSETTSDVGNVPVDYSLNDQTQTTGEPQLGLPTSPSIKSMGGAQGLTVPVDGGTVGQLGFTANNASPVLGDPRSFINDPTVLGSPVMAVDPAYLIGSGGAKSSGTSSAPKSTFGGNTPLNAVSATAPKSTYSTPIDSASPLESYATTTGATNPFELDKLKQLFPGLTPDMAKILMDRVGVSPSVLTALQSSANEPQQNSRYEDISPAGLADFGQPSEFAHGGNVELPKDHKPEFITGHTGHYVQGRGTGQSDDVPAVLHDGDYVIDADTVAALGDGSSKAGGGALEQFRRSLPEHHSGGGQPIPAQIADGEYVLPAGFVTTLGHGSNKEGAKMLDAMREKIRAHKRSAPDSKIPPKAKSPLQYMREAMKG